MHDVGVGYTDDAITFIREEAIPDFVAVLRAWTEMRVAVNFNDKAGPVAAEVDIIPAAYFDLAPEMMTQRTKFAKRILKFGFGRRHVFAKFPGALFGHQASHDFRHLRLPPLEGEGLRVG